MTAARQDLDVQSSNSFAAEFVANATEGEPIVGTPASSPVALTLFGLGLAILSPVLLRSKGRFTEGK